MSSSHPVGLYYHGSNKAGERKHPVKSLGTVLVVGGCGFLGAHLINQLLNFPSEQLTLDLSTPTSQGPNSGRYSYTFPSLSKRYPAYDQATTKIHGLDLKCTRNRIQGCTYHEADITDAAQLFEVFKKVQPDVVINTASPNYASPKPILRKVNIDGTQTLLEVAGGKHGAWSHDPQKRCKAFVHTSSSSVIHDTQSDLRHADERYPLVVPNDIEYYSETKALAEQYILSQNKSSDLGGILTAAVRPAGIIGEGDQGGIAHGVIQTASVAPTWQMNLQIGQGDNLFDTTYVGNVAYALLLVAEALLATSKMISDKGLSDGGILEHERIDGEAFIVTNDQPTYFWEITRFMYSRYHVHNPTLIQGHTGVRVLPEGLAWFVGLMSELTGTLTGRKGKINRQTVRYSVIDRYYSCEKLKGRCGYEPIVGVEEGLVRSVEWVKLDEKSRGGEKKGQ